MPRLGQHPGVCQPRRAAGASFRRPGLAGGNQPRRGRRPAGWSSAMKPMLMIAWRSAWNRRSTLSLVVFSVALSTLLLLGFERIRTDVRENFSKSVSGTDLIVGARTGSV